MKINVHVACINKYLSKTFRAPPVVLKIIYWDIDRLAIFKLAHAL